MHWSDFLQYSLSKIPKWINLYKLSELTFNGSKKTANSNPPPPCKYTLAGQGCKYLLLHLITRNFACSCFATIKSVEACMEEARTSGYWLKYMPVVFLCTVSYLCNLIRRYLKKDCKKYNQNNRHDQVEQKIHVCLTGI